MGIAARIVCFRLMRGDTQLVEGEITILPSPGVSCFGSYRDLTDHASGRHPSIFEGAVVDHVLNSDGSASIGLVYYAAKATGDFQLGFKQEVELKAGLAMGSDSGSEQTESVVLGDHHELVFRTHAVA